jgi:hypothetical protein
MSSIRGFFSKNVRNIFGPLENRECSNVRAVALTGLAMSWPTVGLITVEKLI